MPDKRIARLGTIIVVIHAILIALHSAAHIELDILLGPLGNVFVFVFIIAGPIVAAVLLWTKRQELGVWLLLASMLGSFVFGVYNHFMVHSPDHMSQVPSDGWGVVFSSTAVMSAVVEAWGCLVAIKYLGARAKNVGAAS